MGEQSISVRNGKKVILSSYFHFQAFTCHIILLILSPSVMGDKDGLDFYQRWENSNPERLGGMRETYLCAMPSHSLDLNTISTYPSPGWCGPIKHFPKNRINCLSTSRKVTSYISKFLWQFFGLIRVFRHFPLKNFLGSHGD